MKRGMVIQDPGARSGVTPQPLFPPRNCAVVSSVTKQRSTVYELINYWTSYNDQRTVISAKTSIMDENVETFLEQNQ